MNAWNIQLTKPEAEIILSLLKLYNATWDCGKCRTDCKCERCEAFEEAGSHYASGFESLERKSKAIITSK